MRKTIFTLGLMLAAALSLTNCTKNEESTFTPEVKVPFELYANMDDTRTTYDGIHTKWAANDAINVFHAVAGATVDYVVDYVNDGEFTTENGDGKFKGTLSETLDAGTSYDWYVCYPYNSYMTSPNNTTGGRFYIGCRSDQAQTQTGNNSMAHIKGDNYPLYGVAEDVAASETPSITMSHASSLVEFNVTNKLSEAITVNSIVFTVDGNDEKIVGNFYMAIHSGTPTFTDYTYTSNVATLNVADGEAIAAGASAKFYMGIKPFVADDYALTVAINATSASGKGTCTKELSEVSTTFAPGKIKTLNVGFDAVIEETTEKTVTIDFDSTAQRTSLSNDAQVWKNGGLTFTNSKGSSTTNVASYSNPVRLYKNSDITISSGTLGEITKIEFESVSNGTKDNQKYQTYLESALSSYNPTVVGQVITVELSVPTTEFTATMTAGQVRLHSLTVTYIPADPTAQSMSVNKTSVDVTAEATTEHVIVSLKNLEYSDVTVTSSEPWVVADHAEGDLTLNILENESTDARTATVTISVGEFSETITINQEGKPTLETVTIKQFLEKSTSDTAWYQLTGTISNITSTVFGNFDITDETGTVSVYGLTATQVPSNDQSFASIGLKEGDIVTLIGTRTEYYSSAQVGGPAYYVSHVAACTAPEITCVDNLVTITAEEGTTIYYTIDGTEPSTSSQVYSAPFEITETRTVKAFAIADGKAKSVVSEKNCVYVDPNAEEPTTITYDFAFTSIGTDGWSTKYEKHTVDLGTATVIFNSADKQDSGQPITDCPVTKGQPVILTMKDSKTISGATFVCEQWGSKTQTITLHYSTDGGSTFTSTGITSTNFEISSTTLPTGTNAVKITFSSSKNQVGIASATVTLAE